MGLRGKSVLFALAGTSLSAAAASAAFSGVATPSSQWSIVPFGANMQADYWDDLPNNGHLNLDIVGSLTSATPYYAGFYTYFEPGASATTGTSYFRIRLGARKNNDNGWIMVGVDGNSDGRLDLFVGSDLDTRNVYWVVNKNATNDASTRDRTVVGLPVTIANHAAGNFNYALVTAIDTTSPRDLNNGNSNANTDWDRFASFSIPFSTIVTQLAAAGYTVDSSTPMRFVVGTGSTPNGGRIDEDLIGYNGDTFGNVLWTATQTPAVSMSAVPEPGIMTLTGGVILSGCGLRPRRRVTPERRKFFARELEC